MSMDKLILISATLFLVGTIIFIIGNLIDLLTRYRQLWVCHVITACVGLIVLGIFGGLVWLLIKILGG